MGSVSSSITIFEAVGSLNTIGPVSNFRLTFLQQYTPVSDPNVIARFVSVTNPSSSIGEYLGNITVDACNALSGQVLTDLGFVETNVVGFPSTASCSKVFTLRLVNQLSPSDVPSMTVTQYVTKDHDDLNTDDYYGKRPVYAGDVITDTQNGQSMVSEWRWFGPGDIFLITISLPSAGLWIWDLTVQNKTAYDVGSV